MGEVEQVVDGRVHEDQNKAALAVLGQSRDGLDDRALDQRVAHVLLRKDEGGHLLDARGEYLLADVGEQDLHAEHVAVDYVVVARVQGLLYLLVELDQPGLLVGDWEGINNYSSNIYLLVFLVFFYIVFYL